MVAVVLADPLKTVSDIYIYLYLYTLATVLSSDGTIPIFFLDSNIILIPAVFPISDMIPIPFQVFFYEVLYS